MPNVNSSYLFVIIICYILFYSPLFAQASGNEQLKNLQREIEQLEKELQQKDSRLKSELQKITNIDRQINLIRQKIKIIKKEEARNRKSISRNEAEIDSLTEKKGVLEKLVSRQMVFAYKHIRDHKLEWLISSNSFQQALIRSQYLKKILALEKKYATKLQQTILKLNQAQIALNENQKQLEENRRNAAREEKELAAKRKQQSSFVEKIKKDKKALQKALAEKQASYRKLKEMLANLEKKRATKKIEKKEEVAWKKLSGSFVKNRGKLNWPVRGKLLHKFGRYRNPKLKTILENPGIDIAAPQGSPVRVVFSGIVGLVTYLSGFGNTVIVEHNDGYYTVYSHLEDVTVNTGQYIESGAKIGTVGKSGSLEGPKLHFEIYGKEKPLNPLKWLAKRQN